MHYKEAKLLKRHLPTDDGHDNLMHGGTKVEHIQSLVDTSIVSCVQVFDKQVSNNRIPTTTPEIFGTCIHRND